MIGEKFNLMQYSVNSILGMIDAGQFVIPEIQRPFVWKRKQVRDLIDSLYNGYPTGYIITWKNPDIKTKDGGVAGGKHVFIDGQQRITALMAAISGLEVLDEDFNKDSEFVLDIGSGQSFSLPNYYALCDEIVNALKEHDTLLKKHFSRLSLSSECYKDDSLHLLAFDLMYCSNAYNFYKGLIEPVTKKTIKKSMKPSLSLEEIARLEAERNEKIAELEDEISLLELKCSDADEISLIDVQVTSKQYGVSIVIEQNADKIKVKFDSAEKSFVLNAKYLSRPTFENDDEIIAIFTEYADNKEKIKKLTKQVDDLKSK